MRYLMLVCVDPDLEPGAGEGAPDIETWVDEVVSKGINLIGDRLRPGSEATTVRVRNRELLVSDGPYCETKDLIGGFDVLECEDLDQAIEVASRHPMAWHGVIELRPFWPLDLG